MRLFSHFKAIHIGFGHTARRLKFTLVQRRDERAHEESMKATRKRIRVLILAAVVAAAAVPVGFALSLESSMPPAIAQAALPVAMGTAMPLAPMATFPVVSDSAKLFGLGTLLIALAAAVRRAV